MGERVRKGQLDGVASGQFLCEAAAPSMRVLRMPGVFQSRDEARDVVAHLLPTRRGRGGAQRLRHARRRRPRARRLLHARAGALARGRAPPQAVALGRRRGRHRRLARDGPDHRAAADRRRAPRLRRQAHRRLHRRAVGGARLPVVVGGELRDRPALGLHLRLPRLRRAAVPAADAPISRRRSAPARRACSSASTSSAAARTKRCSAACSASRGCAASPCRRRSAPSTSRPPRARASSSVDRLIPRALLERVLRMLADYRIEHPQR